MLPACFGSGQFGDIGLHPRPIDKVFILDRFLYRVAQHWLYCERPEACERLARNHGVIASFSRALTEGLTIQQSDAEFDKTLDKAISEIAAASKT